MRKLLLSSLVLAMVALPAMASAQTVATGTVAVTANVAPYGSVAQVRALAFGTLARGGNAVVTATDDAANGQALIQYNYAAKVSASLTVPLTGPVVLPMALSCAQSPDNSAGSYVAVGGCTFADRAAPSALALAQYYLGFGGTITQANLEAAPAGNYAGTITITLAQ